MNLPPVLVSACLAGVICRYDGKEIFCEAVQHLVRIGGGVVVCPEQLGGLPTPRSPVTIVGGDGFDVVQGRARVLTQQGVDVTCQFMRGAEETVRLVRLIGVRKAVFKDRSPSCAVKRVYSGEKLVKGCGVTTALLLKEGVEIISEEDFALEYES